MRFSDIQHQDRALSILRRALRSGRTHHAYLFEGPEGVGKELTARALAARLLCADDTRAPDADACGACNACHMLATGNHPDFHLIHRGLNKYHPNRTIRASKGLYLVVDLIRYFVIEPAGMKPTQGRRRVFLLRDAERMNDEAQNALLKTLEEPPGTACLILVTSSAGRLLPTIRSRCQRVPFDLLPSAYVARELQSRARVAAPEAHALAALSGGRLGVALAWQRWDVLAALAGVGSALAGLCAADPESFGKALVEGAAELARRMRAAPGGPDGRPEAEAEDTAEVDEEGEENGEVRRAGGKVVPTDVLRDMVKVELLLLAALYRDAHVVRSGAAQLVHLPQQQAQVARLAEALPVSRLDDGIQAVGEAERMLDRNVAPQLVLERLAVALLGEASPTG